MSEELISHSGHKGSVDQPSVDDAGNRPATDPPTAMPSQVVRHEIASSGVGSNPLEEHKPPGSDRRLCVWVNYIFMEC